MKEGVRDCLAKAVLDLWGGEIEAGNPNWPKDDADSILSALKEAGYLVVPVEPTEAMVDATEDMDIYWGYRADGRPGSPEDVYRAMLTASQHQERG